ncbi:MarR family winged helix-turn-helix transcriptional regulator [Alkaliphilus peptidifermentans]|uniref:DNA-binding transcriptional regulator, MarR family n=1 Tax=Alkaliphilus peptidifermentans DSM 18978 TaxID=1120976 RepID=A0A1G5E2N7_9FIRM|nr:MarR family winged helix-turn-helix transcriptional regulator [Alkaliphilus peptidifermentans]SCY21244.1 DNA-binding transcriptional regulator, MarR family [Alkaliphilus peptidifermentans DSM 18978]
MQKNTILAAEEIAMFCRLQMQVKKGLPIRSSEMGVLIYIQKQDEPVTPLMISNFFQIAKPSVTAMINELIKKKYLVKVPSATDGRSYTVSVTEKGQELVASTHDEYFKVIAILEDKMGDDDFKSFFKLIQKANTILIEERGK